MKKNKLTKEQKIYYITAISTAILAFLAFIGLSFTLLKFMETRFLGYKTVISIFIFIALWLMIIQSGLKRWIKK